MDKEKLAAAVRSQSLADYLADLPQSHDHHTGGRVETVRNDEHKGHHIVIRTTYEIEVDGQLKPIPLGIDNDGMLHCHALPNYQFKSAIDMVKYLIDIFPGDFSQEQEHEVHGGHTHHAPEAEGES